MSGEQAWIPKGTARPSAFSHTPLQMVQLSDESHQAFWKDNKSKRENIFVLSRGFSLYDFCINHSNSVEKNDMIFLINNSRRELANKWIVKACQATNGNISAGSSVMPEYENTLCAELHITHLLYFRHVLDITNDRRFFWEAFDKAIYQRKAVASYAPSRMKIEISTDLTALRYLGSLELKNVKIWGMDFFESDYFGHSSRTLRKAPSKEEKDKGRAMKTDFIKIVKEFPKTKFTLNTCAKFEHEIPVENLVINKLN